MSAQIEGRIALLRARLADAQGFDALVALKGDIDALLADVNRYRHAYETTAVDRDRLAAELADYRHAFETTAADRDRLATELADLRRILESQPGAYEGAKARGILAEISFGLLAHVLHRSLGLDKEAVASRLAHLGPQHDDWVGLIGDGAGEGRLAAAVDGMLKIAGLLSREAMLSDFPAEITDSALAMSTRFWGADHAVRTHLSRDRTGQSLRDYLVRGVASGDWPDPATASAQRMAIARSMPSILLVTLPKSGSMFLYNTISRRLGLPGFAIAVPTDGPAADLAVPELVRIFAAGGMMAQSHLAPSPENLDTLARFGVTRFVVHFRDPRQAAVSWWHYNKKIGVIPDHPLSREERESYVWEGFLEPAARWLRGWLDVARADSRFDILLTTQEAMRRDEAGHVALILRHAGVPEADIGEVSIRRSEAEHFRKGETGEWLEFFSEAFRKGSAGLVPDDIVRRFGWHSGDGGASAGPGEGG